LAKVLLFSNKPETTSLFKALTVDFKGRLSFAEVKQTQTTLLEQFSVKTFPTLVVVKTDGEKITYDGKLNHEELFKFLSTVAPPPAQGASSG
jgi:protein disulfide-isomerase A6